MDSNLQRRELLELIDRLTVFKDQASLDGFVSGVVDCQKTTILTFLNQHGFNMAASSKELREQISQSDYITRDGVGLELLMMSLRHEPGLNANGTDLIPKILAGAADRTVALFGTQEPWLSSAAESVQKLGVKVIATHHGFAVPDVYKNIVVSTKPDIVVLGMGMPNQEKISHVLKRHSNHPCLIVNGGAILDFMAGRFARAPLWVRRMRMEWLFRLINEPRRLFRRYFNGGFQFLLTTFHLAVLQRRTSP